MQLPFSKLKFADLEVSFEGFDRKPKMSIEGTGDSESLVITPRCKCGAELSSYRFGTGISASIKEKMVSLRNEHEEMGKPLRRIPINSTKPISERCGVCGRQVAATVNFVLIKKSVQNFDAELSKAKDSYVYGGIVEISVETEGARFSNNRRTRPLERILSPLCMCANALHPIELNEKFKETVNSVNALFEDENASLMSTEPIEIDETVKCVFCLTESKIKAKIKVNLPTRSTFAQFVKIHKTWKNRRYE